MSGPVLHADDLIVTPQPTDDELAAILVAYEQLWPTAGALPEPSPRWRYAGRRWGRRPLYGGWS